MIKPYTVQKMGFKYDIQILWKQSIVSVRRQFADDGALGVLTGLVTAQLAPAMSSRECRTSQSTKSEIEKEKENPMPVVGEHLLEAKWCIQA